MKEILYCNLNKGIASATKTGGQYTFRPAVAGEVRHFGLRFVEEVGGRTVEVEPEILSLQLSVSKIDARPLGGKIAYQFGPGASTAHNTTAELPWNHNAAALKAAIPPAVIAAHGEPVAEDVPGGVTLTFPSRVDISPRKNSLWPLSFLRSHAWEIPEGDWVHDLRMVQAPLVQTTAWVRELPPAPSVETIRDGGEEPGYAWSEIQELKVPVSFRGTFHLRNPGTLARSVVLSQADNVRTIQEALAAIYPEGLVKVTNPGDEVARMEFLGDYIGQDLPPVEVFVDDAPPGDPTLALDFRLASVYAALRAQESYGATIEARAIIARNGVPQGEPVVLFRAPMQVIRDQNWDGMSTQVTPPWLRPPNPVDYVPYDESQVMVGSAHYRKVIGDGEATEIVVDHNLASEDIAAITVRENASPGQLVEGWTAELTGANSLTLHFAEAPAANSLVVNVTAAGQVSAFQAHVHTQNQVDGLVPALEDLFTRLARVEGLIGRSDVVVLASGNKKTEFMLPTVGEVLPDADNEETAATMASQIAVTDRGENTIGGTTLDTKAKENAVEAKAEADKLPSDVIVRALIPGIGRAAQTGSAARKDALGNVVEPEVPPQSEDPAAWPARRGTKYPVLLQAVTDTTVAEVTALPESPADGSVYRYTGAATDFMLPGDFGRKGQRVPPQGCFAYKQGAFYRVKPEGGSTYYPLEFERELWRVFIGEDQLPPGATLSVTGELRLRLAGEFFEAAIKERTPLDLAARYLLICEAVELHNGATLGAPTATVVLGETKIAVSPALETMRWALTVKNTGGAVSSNWTAYAKSVSQEGFGVPAVLRLRLAGFDVDDARADAGEPVRGQIALIMPATKLEVVS